MIPRSHEFLTRATNLLARACQDIEQSMFANRLDPDFKKLHDAACKLHKRFFAKWEKGVKRGRKEGWIK